MTTYYMINSYVNPDTIYGSENPVCITAEEIKRLSVEFENESLMDDFHEATDDEIAEFGIME